MDASTQDRSWQEEQPGEIDVVVEVMGDIPKRKCREKRSGLLKTDY